MQQSKLKTLYIYKMLDEYSDSEHPLTTRQMMQMLAEKGIKSERKSVYADISALKEAGVDIGAKQGRSAGYYIASRKLDVPEVRLLIDAVNSAGFITPAKTKRLVEKLEGMLSRAQAKAMRPQVFHDAQNKCDNEEIYKTIDILDAAILKKKKVKFTYRRRNIDKKNKKSYTQKTFKVSPYALIWNADHYYLVCNNEKYDNLMNLRIDRIRNIQITALKARKVKDVSEYEKEFDVADYASKVFNMFSGESATVKLLCSFDLQEEIMDRFGAKIPLSAVDFEHFETQVNAAVSDGLVSWLMQYGNGIKVLEPQSLADMVKDKAQLIAELYEQNAD
ncbi:MAG: WYL domain-containing protein [Clostridiales bacterium]|nr:WYL domain-containing protein [Clostridiales bacterium]